jgi:phosphatidylglycerophosphatase A
VPPLRRLCALVLATAGGAGYAPVAPGTFGSLVGVALFACLAPAGPLPVVVAIALTAGLGVWAAD